MIWKRANVPTRHWRRERLRQGGGVWMPESQRACYYRHAQIGLNMFQLIHFSLRASQQLNQWGMYGAVVSVLSHSHPGHTTHRMSHFSLLRKSLCIIKMLPGNTPAVSIFYSASMITWPCQILASRSDEGGEFCQLLGENLSVLCQRDVIVSLFKLGTKSSESLILL